MPKIINLYGNPENRIKAIIDILLRIDPDIICLQEVFCYNIRDILKKELKEKYNICHSLKPKKKFSLSSGLFFATKYKILHNEDIVFKESCGEDYLADKGFQYIIVKNDNKVFTCINTHLNAMPLISAYGNSNLIRIRQIERILDKVLPKSLASSQAPLKKYDMNFFCGDINTEFGTHPQLFLVNSLQKYYSKTIVNPVKISTFQLEQLDYIIYYGEKTHNIEYKKYLTSNESDHHLLSCTVE